MDIGTNLPKPVEPSPRVVEMCVRQASKVFKINPLVIMSIIKVEGGKVGTLSKNKNGTYDMGIMQINTIHLDEIRKKYPRIGWKELTYNPCVNIGVGTSILHKRMSETNDYWRGVGNYHSKTPRFRDAYLAKVKGAYSGMVLEHNRRIAMQRQGKKY